MSTEKINWVTLGKISGLFGVKGWVKIFSNTQPRENILTYSPWYVKKDGHWQEYSLLDGKLHGKSVIAHLSGCDDRDIAAELIDCQIAVKRGQLPDTEEGEYYWSDLKGLRVINLEGAELGKVASMFETGSNDVMVVHETARIGGNKGKERLIPYVTGEFIHEVNLEQGFITVDWDKDF